MDTSVAARFGEDEREFLRIRTDEVLGRIAEDLNCLAREGIAEAKGAKRAAQRAEEIYRGKDLDLDTDEPPEPDAPIFPGVGPAVHVEYKRKGDREREPFLTEAEHIQEQSFGYDPRNDWWPEALSLLEEYESRGLCGNGDVEQFYDRRHVARESAAVFRRVVAAVFPETPGEGGGNAEYDKMILLTEAKRLFGFKSFKQLACFLENHLEVKQDRPLTKAGKPHSRRRRVSVLGLSRAIAQDDKILSDPVRKQRMESQLHKAKLEKRLEEEALGLFLGKRK